MRTGIFPNMGEVKRLTYKKGWSLSDLAKQANLSLNTIFALQAKRRRASERTVYKLANALDVSPAEIIEK
ncbi:helix-turn-helix domain-containing protein [Acidaminococcus massiliensis]|uniref:helix-turn-helix domain-containing protein n=1 Tax=Acidaminococcus massiliensis TaxID=1852375 RepID=UPI0026DB9EFD|nr:helix-turn-helix transcriptional regulator [Acidaminococcus massiliensis]